METKKGKFRAWLKDPYNLTFLGIIVLTVIIRLYYFWITKNQPLWWDESEYMSTAKSIAGIIHLDYTFALNRIPGFPLLASLFYIVGISSEPLLKFFLAFIPSILSIILMYFVLILMYSDKRIALISVAIFSVLWEHIFYSNRFQTESLSLIFEFLAIMVLFGVYLTGKDYKFIKNKHSLYWIALFTLLCIIFRSANMVFIAVIIIFLIAINFYRLWDKYKIYSVISLIALIVISFVSLIILDKKFAFIHQFYRSDLPIYWAPLSVFYGFYQSTLSNLPSVLFYTFLLGLVLIIGKIIIFPEGLKKVNKNIENNDYKSDIFNIILILGFLAFFIFLLRPGGFEFRWFFAFLPAMFAFTAKGMIKFAEAAQSLLKIKHLAILLILIILSLGVYTQYVHADGVVKNKIDSYAPVKDGALWLKENYNKSEKIITASAYQTAYYSEMNVSSFSNILNETDFNNYLNINRPRFLEISAFEASPNWVENWLNENKDKAKPIKVYYADIEKQNPILIIFEINYS